ncbi:MAG: hypothetical protein RIC95_03160 [Vicingaceae bacterium]
MKQFGLLFILFYSISTFSQDANYILPRSDYGDFDNIASLLHQADSINEDSIHLKVYAINTSTQSTSFIDLSYNVNVKLFSQKKNVHLQVLKKHLKIATRIRLIGEIDGVLDTLNRADTLVISPTHDMSSLTYQLGSAFPFPYHFNSLETVEVAIAESAFDEVLSAESLNDVLLEISVLRARYFWTDSLVVNPQIIKQDGGAENELRQNEALIKWDKVLQPVNYEIELLFIPHSNPSSISNVEYDFSKNARRYHTDLAYFPVSLFYPNGFLICRARANKPKLTKDSLFLSGNVNLGSWSLADSGSVNVASNNVLTIENTGQGNSLTDLNWQYKANRAEKGKGVEQISYFDGTNRLRQNNQVYFNYDSTTSINAQESFNFKSFVISQEAYYDHNGIEVLSVLPSPIPQATDISFQRGLNIQGTSKLKKTSYDSLNYETTFVLNKDSIGAANYYSAENPALDIDSSSSFIPDANGLPFSKSNFMADGSNRLESKTQPGLDKAFNTSKGTRFAYSRANRQELEALFGTNVGKEEFYKKEFSIDPNGVMTISYKDQSDRTIASAISGTPEGRSDMVPLPFSNRQIKLDLISSGADEYIESENSYEMSYSMFVPEGATYQFYYGFDSSPFQNCSNSTICYDCSYRYDLQIIDSKNKLIFQSLDTVDFSTDCESGIGSYYLKEIDSLESNYSASLNEDTLSIDLAAQTGYTILKKLSLITDSMTVDAENFFQSGECGQLDYEYFELKELDKMDYQGCEKSYSYLKNSYCDRILEDLKIDFHLGLGDSAGVFVKLLENKTLGDLIYLDNTLLNSIKNALANTFSCQWFQESGCFGDDLAFYEYIKQELKESLKNPNYSVSTPLSTPDIANRLADKLVVLHPNYCQYQICLQKYETDSHFDQILERSNNLEEFVDMGINMGVISDSIDFEWNLNDSSYTGYRTRNGVVDTLKNEAILYPFDPVLKFASGGELDSLEHYASCSPTSKDGVAYYSTFVFNEFVRNCEPKLDSFNRKDWYRVYYENLMKGCEDPSIIDTSLYYIVKQISGLNPQPAAEDTTLDFKWSLFKNLYQEVRKKVTEDMMASLICVNPKSYVIDPDCTVQPRDTTVDCLIPEEIPEHCDGCLPINLACSTDIIERYWSTSHARFRPFIEEFEDTLDQMASNYQGDSNKVHQIGGKRVYQLLKYNSCLSIDSTLFVDTFNVDSFVCQSYSYLNNSSTFSGAFNNCDLDTINLASILIDLLPYKKDSALYYQVDYYSCADQFKDSYTFSEIDSVHQLIVSEGVSVPVIDSVAEIDIFNAPQKRYAFRMNAKLGLNLGFRDYFNFYVDNTLNNASTPFGNTALSSFSNFESQLVEVLKLNPENLNYYNETTDSIAQYLNFHLDTSGYDTLEYGIDFIGLGEQSLDNKQYDMYYYQASSNWNSNLKDTLQNIYDAVMPFLYTNGFIGDFTTQYGLQVVHEHLDITSLNTVEIERAAINPSGKVWVRLVNSSDTSYYDDYYFYYTPFNYYYDYNDVGIFASIKPIFHAEEFKYVSLGFSHLGRKHEMLASRKSGFGNATRLGKVVLGKNLGKSELPEQETCVDLAYEQAVINAEYKYNNYVSDMKEQFQLDMRNYCSNRITNNPALENRRLNMSYASGERHFTLYYYDQAGNLVQTVPPGGVELIDSIPESEIDDYREGISSNEVLPQHGKATVYKYNSENQIIRQNTPNGGVVEFWYDDEGRLVLSQNEEQAMTHKYSYTLHDSLSRVFESGEVVLTNFARLNWGEIQSNIILELIDSMPISINEFVLLKNRNYVSRTLYDTALLDVANYEFKQENLRSRVATQAYYHHLDTNSLLTNWEYATHFSYDVMGNVKSVLNDYFQNGTITNQGHRFKRIDYDYDQISGNVLQVNFQHGKNDALYHKYEYDSQNRITKVETSKDGIIWDEDAEYTYYLHGPLARQEIGTHKIQGVDYAYTLEGYLKSVNSGHHETDMGNDATKDNIFASDAFGYSLYYNQNDYDPIAGASADLNLNFYSSQQSDLYNGNIGAISKHIGDSTFGKKYTYDQLSRLVESQEKKLDVGSRQWDSVMIAQSNTTFYDYDKNGNLIQLDRVDGESKSHMDILTYNYINGTDKLNFVEDKVGSKLYGNDIDQQVTNNYVYDKVGNLIADSSEGIYSIDWYPNGKVKSILRDYPSREKSNLFFDYDAMGNRVKKIVSFEEGNRGYIRTQYYVRDAQGNVLATYEERNCNYFGGEDSIGSYYYQYSEKYDYYSAIAAAQLGDSVYYNYLNSNFTGKEDFLAAVGSKLGSISGIRDSVFKYLNLEDYISLYPHAKQRLLIEDSIEVAKYLFENKFDYFFSKVNAKHEAYIQYLMQTDSIGEFYNSLDNIYDDNYTLDEGALFYGLFKDFVSDNRNNLNLLYSLSAINTNDTADYNAALNSKSAAVLLLKQLFEDLDSALSSGTPLEDQYADINFALSLSLLHDYNSSDVASLLEQVTMNTLYNEINTGTYAAELQLNLLLGHLKGSDSGDINSDSLIQYTPSNVFDYAIDSNGVLLDYYLHTDTSISQSYNVYSTFFNDDMNFKKWAVYFKSDSSEALEYVKTALLENWNDNEIDSALIALDSIAINYFQLTEAKAYLTNYLLNYHPLIAISIIYQADLLQSPLSQVPHLTPIRFAQEMQDSLGVQYDTLSACSPFQAYMLPVNYIIYGSERLGIMEADKSRQVSNNKFIRTLGQKQYELKDHLGNVVATVSDKKLHPQETVVNGNQSIDSTLGYQADLTSRFDYYPFGMEIKSRSGNFTDVDYTTTEAKLIYSGLFNNCTDYKVIPRQGATDTDSICMSATNLYGESYITQIKAGYDTTWDKTFFLQLQPVIDDVIPNLDTTKTYRLYISVASGAQRMIRLKLQDTLVIPGIESDPDAMWPDLIAADEKYLSVDVSGAEIMDNVAGGNRFRMVLRCTHLFDSTLAGTLVEVTNVKIFEINDYVTTPFAKRDNKAYPYGFGGHERQDEVSGSGNNYTFGDYGYDPRLGRRWNIDPLAKEFPWQSPYATFNNNPINFVDPSGLAAEQGGHIPVNEVLKSYGYASREETLFPEPGVLETAAKVLKGALDIVGPGIHKSQGVIQVVTEGYVDAVDNYNKDPNDADRDNVQQYYDNLTDVDSKLTTEIQELKIQEEELRQRDRELGIEFNRQEAADYATERFELEEKQATVRSEIEGIKPILDEPIVYE